MELKEYQQKTLNQLKEYLNALEKCADNKRKLAEMNIPYDLLEEAWRMVKGTKDYQSRQNGLGESIPQICFKVPTGGGKTLLAAHAIDAIKTYYIKQASLVVLWIVPSEAIYRQTFTALRNREHPYRQSLDRASGGRTLILEKTDQFSPTQYKEHLVVILLMLPSANRQNKETLKMFQDSSGFEEFFPAEDDHIANQELVSRIPNLRHYGGIGGPIITSLGNTLCLLKPLAIIDEGHKAYSEIALDTIRSFNSRFILELSATPSTASNVLVNIRGQELNREQMIKLDLNIYNMPSYDWKDTLISALQKLELLQSKAEEYRLNGGRYIRPICLIQVERTGKDQQTGHFIHANEVVTELIKQGLEPSAIAIKSSENDGLENIDLLDEDCSIRYIITNRALQEGWDCPFAYVLVVLTNPSSQTAITQLVGRVLRQPDGKKTGIKELDESYVFCFRRKANQLLSDIRRSFDEEGLGDLSHRAHLVEEVSEIEVNWRPEFQKFAGKIFLPRFVIEHDNQSRLLSYEMDILSQVDWSQVDYSSLPTALGVFPRHIQHTGVNIKENSGVEIIEKTGGDAQVVELTIDLTFVTLQLADIVPNPWVAYDIAQRVIEVMVQRYDRQRVATDLILIITDLKILLERERDKLAQQVFLNMVKQGEIHFVLNIDYGYILPNSIRVKTGRKLTRDTGDPIQRSLFEAVMEDELNPDEQDIAVHLDKQEQFILWWDRNFARSGYFVQGWEKERIYPDFLVGKLELTDPTDYSKIIVLETKGRHLDNPETEYKKNVFQLCNELAKDWDARLKGKLDIKQVEFYLVFHDEARSQINKLLH